MTSLLRPSLLHRLFGVHLGSALEFLKSKSDCGLGFDILTTIGSAGLFAALMLFSARPVAAVALFVAIATVEWFIVMPFDSAERLARARRRRRECVHCGISLTTENDGMCATCRGH